jgi:ribosome biogenesis GTPase A
LREKREKKKSAQDLHENKVLEEEEEERIGPVLPSSSSSSATTGSSSTTRADLRSIFEIESKETIEERKKDAYRPCIYATDRGHSQSIYVQYHIQDPKLQPKILFKPKWHPQMSIEELQANDQQAYEEWIQELRHDSTNQKKLNLYERNLEVWRQLWRVLEKSNVLIHLADARCPILHLSDQLMKYVLKTLYQKKLIIVLTKSDLVSKERVQEWISYLQERYGKEIPILAHSQGDNVETSNALLMRTIGQLSLELIDIHDETLTIGFVGEPNVGKSSLLNSLFKRKLVSVSSTPGHTKHLQTHYFEQVDMLERMDDKISKILVCDCPGVVFPRFNVPLSLQILFGSFPIAQTREPYSAIRFIAENCLPSLEVLYKLKKIEEDDGDWSPYTLCESYAEQRGFHVKGGKLDVYRAANLILRDTLNGKKVVLSFPPPIC